MSAKILYGFQINGEEARMLNKQFPNTVYFSLGDEEESDVSGYSEEEDISEIMSDLVEKLKIKFASLNLKHEFKIFITDFEYSGKIGNKKFKGNFTIVVGILLGDIKTQYDGVIKCPKTPVKSREIKELVQRIDGFKGFKPDVGFQIYSAKEFYGEI